MDKVMDEEREKIAVNATAPAATVLLPKYAGAARKLAAVRSEKSSPAKAPACRGAGRQRRKVENPKSENPWLEDELKPVERTRVKNPWLEED